VNVGLLRLTARPSEGIFVLVNLVSDTVFKVFRRQSSRNVKSARNNSRRTNNDITTK